MLMGYYKKATFGRWLFVIWNSLFCYVDGII